MRWLNIRLQGWHIGAAVLKDHCWNVALPFHLCSSGMDRFINIYAQGTQECGKQTKKKGVVVSAGESKVVFFCFPVNLWVAKRVSQR